MTLAMAAGATACGSDEDSASSGDVASGAGLAGKKVCVDQYTTAPQTDAIVKGFQRRLGELPSTDALEVTIKNPEGDAGTQQTLAKQFIDEGCDVLVPLATAGSQLYAKTTSTVPVVYSAVSTPREAGLVQDFKRPGGNVTGVAAPLPVTEEIDAMLKVMPDMRRVGLIWKNGDPAGDANAEQAKAHLADLGIDAIDAPISSAADASTAVQSLVGKVDAIELPCDGTTIAAGAGIVKVARDASLPVFGCSGDAVKAGAVLAGAYSYEGLGELTAELAVKIANGADPATTPVTVAEVPGFDLNVTEAESLGLTIPEELVDRAPHVY
ncbi:MAG TPA: ABC transporter substrate-binding protein [Capillimicrobium sp.]